MRCTVEIRCVMMSVVRPNIRSFDRLHDGRFRRRIERRGRFVERRTGAFLRMHARSNPLALPDAELRPPLADR